MPIDGTHFYTLRDNYIDHINRFFFSLSKPHDLDKNVFLRK